MSWYRHDLVTGWGGSALVTEKNTGIIEKKERRDISTTHHWSVRNSIGTEENMESYHQQIFPSNCRDLQKTAFSLNYQSDECTLLQNASKLSYTVLTPIWWLPLFQVSGEKGSSDTEFYLQESPRYNIPLSGTTRLDSLSSSVANGELRWTKCPGLRWMIGPGQQKQKVKTPEAKNPAWPEPQGSHKKMLQKTMVITIKDS